MSLSLILIGSISLIVIAGTVYLFFHQNEELTDKKKGLILLIVGIVIFLSFLVTTFKHRNLGLRSSQLNDGSLDIKKVFFGGNCGFQYEKKIDTQVQISEDSIRQMEKRNFMSLYDASDKEYIDPYLESYQENVLFLSKKDEGASYFLNKMAKKVCAQRKVGVIYMKLDREIRSEKDFLKKIGVHSFEQLQKHYCHFSKVDIKINEYGDAEFIPKLSADRVAPYLILDNFQYLLNALADPSSRNSFTAEEGSQEFSKDDNEQDGKEGYVGRKRLFDKIVKELVHNCRVNIILNTQREEAIEEIYQIWQYNQHGKKYESNMDKKVRYLSLEYHRWQGLKQYDLFKIISNSFPVSNDNHLSKILQINKQETYTFRDLFTIMKQVQKRSKSLKGQKQDKFNGGMQIQEWQLKSSVARYYGLSKSYQHLKISQNRKISHIKEKINYDDLIKLEQLDLIEIRKAVVYLK